jgi:hypothetical protein
LDPEAVDFGAAASKADSLLLENELGISPVMTPTPTMLNRITETAASTNSGLVFFVSCMMALLEFNEDGAILTSRGGLTV